MRIAVPKEIATGERRVSLVPDTVGRLVESGMQVLVESDAGAAALHSDQAYRDAGATVLEDPVHVYDQADVVLKVQAPLMNEALGRHEADLLPEGATVVAFLQPLVNLELAQRLASGGVTAFSMDAVPRIARAQSMDALTSMASIAGYKAALIAADSLGRFIPMLVTAAGTLAPARGLVLGAGVAGLQAIATGRRMGAVMSAFDVRPAVSEQVKSLGANFIEVQVIVAEAEHESGYAKELSEESQRRERELIHEHTQTMDFVISTAAVPGSPAPKLVSGEMVKDMRSGSVIVDVAAETGGNCELTQPGSTVVEHGVTIHGPLNLPSSMPVHASQMYSRNISTLLLHLVDDGRIVPDFDDEITKGCCITYEGSIVHESTLSAEKALLGSLESEAGPVEGSQS